MKFKIKEIVSCRVETRDNKMKAVVSAPTQRPTETKQFEIIATKLPYNDAEYYIYSILIPDDYLGWTINGFHTKHNGVDLKFIGKKFWDITEEYMTKEKKK